MSYFRFFLQRICQIRYSGIHQVFAFGCYFTKISTNNILFTVNRPLFNLLSTISGVDQEVRTISHEELSNKLDSGAPLCLIDVREPGELANDGFIKESLPIPLGELHTSLTYSNEEFKEMYGVDKPKYGEEVVFMCRVGVRSKFAMKIASSVGYTNVRHFAEGWDGWKSR